MILQQYKELLKLRNVEMQKGKTLADVVKKSGGKPTDKEYQIITEKAMFHFINEVETKENEVKELHSKVSSLENRTPDFDLSDYIRFMAKQIASYEVNECDGTYVGTESKTSFIYDCKDYDMTLNIFWEKQNHIEISVKSEDVPDYDFSEMAYF